MDVNNVLSLVKARLGITSEVRDTYLTAIIEGVISELEDEKGLVLTDSPYHLMFVVDYATWRYQNVGQVESDTSGALSIPRHLQFRLHNLFLSARGGSDDV